MLESPVLIHDDDRHPLIFFLLESRMTDLICPRCRLKDTVKRCPKDQSYMVTPDAYQSAAKDPLLGHEIAGKYGISHRGPLLEALRRTLLF